MEVVGEQAINLVMAEGTHEVTDALANAACKKAMEVKLKFIEDIATWTLTKIPSGHCLIEIQWVFKVKKDPI